MTNEFSSFISRTTQTLILPLCLYMVFTARRRGVDCLFRLSSTGFPAEHSLYDSQAIGCFVLCVIFYLTCFPVPSNFLDVFSKKCFVNLFSVIGWFIYFLMFVMNTLKMEGDIVMSLEGIGKWRRGVWIGVFCILKYAFSG